MPPLNTFQRSCIALAVTQAFVLSEAHGEIINVILGECTLRQAILTANIDSPAEGDCHFGLGADTIVISSLSLISDSSTSYNYAGTDSMLPTITSDITIQSTVAGGTTIERDASAAPFRIFAVDPDGKLTLDSITVKNGIAPNGGGIYVKEGMLDLINSTVTGNTATANGAGIHLSYGALALTDSTVSLNNSTAGSGGIYSYRPDSFVLTDSTVSNNTAATLIGGIGIFGDSSIATINGGQINNNMASTAGGGIYVSDVQLTMTNVTLSNNIAQYGAGLYAYTATVNFAGGMVKSNIASDSGGAFQIKDLSLLNLTNTTVMSNQASNAGGAVCLNDSYLGIDSSKIMTNTVSSVSGSGGAIFALEGLYTSQVVIQDSSLSGNSAQTGGVMAATVDEVKIESSTLSNNSATNMAAGISQDGGTFFMRNSTLSGNQAMSSTALALGTTASKIYNSTIFNNVASGAAPAAVLNAQGGLTIWNSVMGGSTGAVCILTGPTFNNSNWFEDSSCDGTAAGKPRLNPLANNNLGLPGKTLTHAPALSSALLGAADTLFCGNSAVAEFKLDQRGAARGTTSCTIGAVENGVEGEFDSACYVLKSAGGQVAVFCL